jgi:hypothetical protein
VPKQNRANGGELPEGFVIDSYASDELPPGGVLNDDNERSISQKLIAALQYGAANRLAGYGSTLNTIGEEELGDTLKSTATSIAPKDYKPASADFFDPTEPDKGFLGYGWSYLPRMTVESLPGLVADLGVGAATGGAGFVVSNAAANFGPNLETRMEHQAHGAEPSLSDYGAATAATIAEAALSRVGLNNALSTVAKGAGAQALKQVPEQVAKAGAVDALAGAAGNTINQAGRTAGTEDGLSIDPHELIGSAASSGALGSTVRATRGIGDAVNAVRYSDVDPTSAARVVDHFDKVGEPTDAQSARRALGYVQDQLGSVHARSKAEALKALKSDGRDTYDLRSEIGAAEVELDQGYTPQHRIDALHERIGDTEEGLRLIQALQDLSTLNKLMSKGIIREDTFSGGVSSSNIAERHFNPANTFKSPVQTTALSGLGLASLGGISELAQIGLSPMTLLQAVAAKGALYGGLRGVDAIAGSRNPVHEFTSRFRGLDKVQRGRRGRDAVEFLNQIGESAARYRAKLLSGEAREED